MILLQCKFFLIEFLNISINFIPIKSRHIYLKIFRFDISKSSAIHRNVKFFHIGKLKIGHNSTVNFGCYLDNRRGIYIGNNVGVAHDTKIYTLGHNLNSPFFETKGSAVHIEDNAFVFSNCLIMPGVRIKEGAIILPGSIVTKDVDPYTIVGGNPAKFIKYRNPEIGYLHKYKYFFAL
ncbi:hypothetical protein GCM10028819_36920 [Spirosoma humi]